MKTLISEAEYMAIEEEDGGPRYELDEGELVEMPSATFDHNDIRGEVELAFRLYLREHKLGQVVSETDFRLWTNLIRRPDLMFFLNATIAGVDRAELPVPVIPEFVLEVISPSESSAAVERKLRQYERAGVRTVFLVYPSLKSAVVCEGGQRRELDEQDSLEIAYLPGFSLPLSPLFA
ncbi:MAG: Uma2 family endonuclease [Acidobacteria bacterium]|nr:Uma2 family endonuclease [Acidobacteriota bacterium]